MGKKVRLSSSVVLLFCLLTLVYMAAYVAGPAKKAAGFSFDVLNPEAEMIQALDLSIIKSPD